MNTVCFVMSWLKQQAVRTMINSRIKFEVNLRQSLDSIVAFSKRVDS